MHQELQTAIVSGFYHKTFARLCDDALVDSNPHKGIVSRVVILDNCYMPPPNTTPAEPKASPVAVIALVISLAAFALSAYLYVILFFPYWFASKTERVEAGKEMFGDPGTISGRPWGPEQATGAPNTLIAGDQITAWASATTDGQDEWLLLDFALPVRAQSVVIYESYNPGAVYKISSFRGIGPAGDLGTTEMTLWDGQDPVVVGSNGIGVAEIPLPRSDESGEIESLDTIKIYIESTAVAGWNEIDAVGLKDEFGTIHWATEADASSTFADVESGVFFQQQQ